MAVPLVLDDVADATDLSINKMWLKTEPSEKENYKLIANVETGHTNRIYKDSSLSGLGTASRIVQNASVIFESPVQGFMMA